MDPGETQRIWRSGLYSEAGPQAQQSLHSLPWEATRALHGSSRGSSHWKACFRAREPCRLPSGESLAPDPFPAPQGWGLMFFLFTSDPWAVSQSRGRGRSSDLSWSCLFGAREL